jgi:septal ring factor EnvC (AmiA/AmiB activator)
MTPLSQRNLLNSATLLVILVLWMWTSADILAQNKQTISGQISQLEKEIAYTNSLLKETQKSKKVSLIQLNLLNKQIKKQEKLVSVLRREIQTVETEISNKQLLIHQKEEELGLLKDEYAKLIVFARKNLNQYDRMMFIFASKNFNQAYKRIKYFEQYSQYRKNQVRIIKSKQDSLQSSVKMLTELKAEKTKLRKKEEEEIRGINSQKIEQERGLKDLKSREKQLKSDLRKKNKQKEKLQRQIEKILAEEARKAKEFDLTPEQILVSNKFEENKGRLPWPVLKGVVYSSFGEHAHPVLKGIKTRNDGIDIVTKEGSNARVIFEGEIRSVISVPGSANFAVLVKHGTFFSLYSNLEKVFVNPGDKVGIRQEIGKISKDEKDNTTKLQFQIWQSTNKLNPVNWLSK